jgi:hypothetical protein
MWGHVPPGHYTWIHYAARCQWIESTADLDRSRFPSLQALRPRRRREPRRTRPGPSRWRGDRRGSPRRNRGNRRRQRPPTTASRPPSPPRAATPRTRVGSVTRRAVPRQRRCRRRPAVTVGSPRPTPRRTPRRAPRPGRRAGVADARLRRGGTDHRSGSAPTGDSPAGSRAPGARRVARAVGRPTRTPPPR